MSISNRSMAERMIRHRGWIIVSWLAIAGMVAPLALNVKDRLSVSASAPGSQSAHVDEVIASHFSSGFSRYAILVIEGADPPHEPAGRQVLVTIRDSLINLPFVTRTFSWLDVGDTMFAGEHGETFVIVGLDPGSGENMDELVPRLRAVTERFSMPGAPDDRIRLRWTGEIALNHDLRMASSRDAGAAERRVMPVTLILLVIAFGALAAASLPLLSASLAITMALGAAVVISDFWPLSILLQNVVTMLGLGLGIDYALLVVARFREALSSGCDPEQAAAVAADTAGRTIVLSGASVAIGFTALLFIPVNEIQSLGIGGLLVVVMAVLLAITLLPAVLATLGSRVNWGAVRLSKQNQRSHLWKTWGRIVCAHPWLVLVAAGAPTLFVAYQSTRLSSDLPRGDWLPHEMESALALQTLRHAGLGGVVNSIRVVVALPTGYSWDSPSGWAALKKASDAIAVDSRVSRVRSLPTVTGMSTPNLQAIAAVPSSVRDALASRDGRHALIEIVPSDAAGLGGAMDLVRDLRVRTPVNLTGLAGSGLEVGGFPAFNVDYRDAIGDRFPSVVMAVVLVTMVALMIGFRSVLIAVKAVVLNLLSVSVSFGAVVLVFQDGYGIELLGLSSPLDGTFTAIPIIVFCVVFGLSMDYEVFLVARVAEARRAGADESEAIAEGLARTGGVITSAASIMIVVFAAFALGEFVLIKILGFALGVAVFVDATIMRVAIGPALLQLAGRWNWWPGEMSRGRLVKERRLSAESEAYT